MALFSFFIAYFLGQSKGLCVQCEIHCKPVGYCIYKHTDKKILDVKKLEKMSEIWIRLYKINKVLR